MCQAGPCLECSSRVSASPSWPLGSEAFPGHPTYRFRPLPPDRSSALLASLLLSPFLSSRRQVSLSVSGLEGKFHGEDTLPSLMHPQGGRPQIMLSTALTKYCYHYCYQCYYSDRFFLSEDALIGVLAPPFLDIQLLCTWNLWCWTGGSAV